MMWRQFFCEPVHEDTTHICTQMSAPTIIFQMEIQMDQLQTWFCMVAYLIYRGRQA